jgi:hypothetical protein
MMVYKIQMYWCVLNPRSRRLRFPQARPSELVLSCRIYCSSEFQSSPQDEVRIPQELSSKENYIRLAFLQVIVGLFAVEDESDGADLEVRKGLLDSSRKGNLHRGCIYFRSPSLSEE